MHGISFVLARWCTNVIARSYYLMNQNSGGNWGIVIFLMLIWQTLLMQYCAIEHLGTAIRTCR
jgi:hypothetical protein